MPRSSKRLLPSQQAHMTELGERLQRARLRRRIPARVLAVRAGLSTRTLSRIEQGDPSVAIRSYVRVLGVLYLESDLDLLGRDCALIRRLYDAPTLRQLQRRGRSSPAWVG
jgi:transcriptional regulator with XRE-family HTH domain